MSERKIAKSAITVSVITMLSRVLGYVRDAISAALFGVGFVSDAFFVAYRIPNLLRNLLAEGALSTAFIPVFTDYLEKKEKKYVWNLVSNALTILSIVLIFITFLGIVFAPFIVLIIAPGFKDDIEKFNLTVKLTRLIFPFIFFVSISALFLGILNSLKKFSIPAFAPVVLNISIILSGIFLCPLFGKEPEEQIYGWVIGTLIGAFLQILIQYFPAQKNGFKYKFFINLKEEGIKRILKLIAPATLAQSVTQINILINTILASLLVEGSVTYLYYGNRLMQLPLGVFGVALATVSYPYISSYVSQNNYEKLRDTVHTALKQAFFIVIPSSIGIIFLSKEINILLFYHGRFSLNDAYNTANVTIMYSIGIFAYSGVKILTQVFYAIDKPHTAVKIGIFALILNAILSIILMFPLKYLGLALATSISGIINFTFLYFFAINYIGDIKTKDLLKFVLKIVFISLIMGICVYIFANFLEHLFNYGKDFSKKANAIIVFLSILFGILIYIVGLFIFKIKETKKFFLHSKKKSEK